jgi:cyclic pyranopterin phosphate synthase
MVLIDSCGRPLLNLRVAVTNKCNLGCSYCHGEGEEKESEQRNGEMSSDEIARIVAVAVDLGITRVKLTGGEPLMRKDVVDIVRKLSAISGLTDLSMTSNGTMLEALASELRKAGLKRMNISLPTLDSTVFNRLTGGNIDNVVTGVNAAVEAGLCPVKLNMLILNGINDEAVPDMIEFAAKTGTVLQLIELEPVNLADSFYRANHQSLDSYEEALQKKALKVETRRFMQNRHVYCLPDVKVETVRPIENTDFCQHCSRLRITSDGKLKPCLMKNDNLIDFLTPLRKGASDKELAELFVSANEKRRPFNRKQD